MEPRKEIRIRAKKALREHVADEWLIVLVGTPGHILATEEEGRKLLVAFDAGMWPQRPCHHAVLSCHYDEVEFVELKQYGVN